MKIIVGLYLFALIKFCLSHQEKFTQLNLRACTLESLKLLYNDKVSSTITCGLIMSNKPGALAMQFDPESNQCLVYAANQTGGSVIVPYKESSPSCQQQVKVYIRKGADGHKCPPDYLAMAPNSAPNSRYKTYSGNSYNEMITQCLSEGAKPVEFTNKAEMDEVATGLF